MHKPFNPDITSAPETRTTSGLARPLLCAVGFTAMAVLGPTAEPAAALAPAVEQVAAPLEKTGVLSAVTTSTSALRRYTASCKIGSRTETVTVENRSTRRSNLPFPPYTGITPNGFTVSGSLPLRSIAAESYATASLDPGPHMKKHITRNVGGATGWSSGSLNPPRSDEFRYYPTDYLAAQRVIITATNGKSCTTGSKTIK